MRAVLRALLRALRPAQWVKNFFVLAPAIFAGRLHDPAADVRVALAFATFCATASAVYLVNDLRDAEEDRRHPLKRLRPIASGALPAPVALAATLALATLAAIGAARLGGGFAVPLAIYGALNVLYSFGMKHVVILDVMTIALGFVLRVVAGGAAAQAQVSSWLLLCTIFVALFLGFSKRRHELVLLDAAAPEQRRVLSHYSPAFLDQMINVVTASTVLAYSLYAVAPETVQKYHTDRLVYTVPMVLFGIFRYLYLIYQRPGERNPTEAILLDPPSLVNLALWGGAVLWIVYG